MPVVLIGPINTSAFNGGKSQVNTSFLQIDGTYPFLNCLKTAQSWSVGGGPNAPVTPDTLDVNGYPTSFVAGGNSVNTIFFVPPQNERPGNYVITWDGLGTITLGMQNTLVSGSLSNISGGIGRYVFSTTDFRFAVNISGIGSPHITNLKVFHADDEPAINAGQVFGAKFKAKLMEANFGVIRFGVSWLSVNTSNITTWSTNKPVGYWSYGSYELRSSIYAGVTTNSGNAYSASFPSIHSSTGAAWASGGPLDKDTIHVLFNVSATQIGTCSLNVGSSGAVNILSEIAAALNSDSYPIGGDFHSFATLVYDAQLNAWIKQGADTAASSAGLSNGTPIEVMVQLCKEVGAHPWFSSPPLACTPMTDWHTQLATYCRNNGPSWMVPRIEGPNELWNTAAGFYQTGYANAIATSYGWGADFHNWMGKAMSTIGQAVNAVYGGTPGSQTKYQVICGVQTSTGSGASGSDARLASTQYLLQSPQAGYTATAAFGWVTHICTAQYYTPSDYGTGAETTLATAFAGKAFVASIASGVMTVTAINASNSAALAIGDTIFGTQIYAAGDPIPAGVTITSLGTGTGGLGTYNLSNGSLTVASQNMTGGADLTAPVTYANTSNSGAGSFTLANIATLYGQWKTWAQGFGIQKMCGYEGGYSPDFTSNGNSLADMLRGASKQTPNLGTFTTTNYNNFVGLTGGGFTAEFPSCFYLSGNPNCANGTGLNGFVADVWSVADDAYQSPNSPQFAAIVTFNH